MDNLPEYDREARLRAAAKVIGYKEMPPGIDEFIDDPYYLGNIFGGDKLYPYWRQKLKEIFPDPIHIAYPIVSLTGAIGTGKSTMAKIMALYNLCKIYHLESIDFFGIAKTKGLDFIFFHVNQGKAYSDFIESIDMIVEESPFFSKMWPTQEPIATRMKTDGVKSNSGIGGDVIFYNLSEINFVAYDRAWFKIDQAIKRFKSRFQKIWGYFGNIIIDTSAQGDNSITENFITNNPYGKDVYLVRAAIWDAKAHLNIYFKKGEFFVYTGDSIHQPFIIKDMEKDITDKMDRDRIIRVPMESYADFQYDIITALQDQAGVSTKSTGKYIVETDPFRSCLKIPQYHEDVLIVDFYDRTDRLFDKVSEQMKLVPKDRKLYVRFDIGVTGDLAGVAVTHFDGYEQFSDKTKLKRPKFRTPVMLSLSRNKGEETSISHMHDFIYSLIENGWEIGNVTYDQYQSRQSLQDLQRVGIPASYLSVDRTDAAYIFFKNQFNSGLWEGTKNDLFEEEICNLLHQDGKVDHDENHSKDVSDAVVGSVYDCYEHLDEAEDSSKNFKADQQIAILKEMGRKPTDEVQDLLGGYSFGS